MLLGAAFSPCPGFSDLAKMGAAFAGGPRGEAFDGEGFGDAADVGQGGELFKPTLAFGGTYAPGFAIAIEEDFKVPLASLNVLIAGAGGGAGQAIATQCCLQSVRKLVMINRSLDKLANLREKLHAVSPNTEIKAFSFDDPALAEACLSCDLIVNTSSVGLKPSDPSILPVSCLSRDHLVYDTIYQPPMTPLLVAAESLGCQTANGLSMLIHQGALAFQYWFAGAPPLAVMRDAMRALD